MDAERQSVKNTSDKKETQLRAGEQTRDSAERVVNEESRDAGDAQESPRRSGRGHRSLGELAGSTGVRVSMPGGLSGMTMMIE
eukprot:6200224-Pleurochrysis_carterae.AAC.1